MEAIILAAGVSRRLYPVTYNTPKCLLEVGGKPITNYQLEALQANGITNITMVIGYYREMLVEHLEKNFPDLNFNFITNQHFFETNTSYSVNLCSEVLRSNEILLMNGDVLYPVALLERIIKSPKKDVLAVDAKSCDREEVKVIEGADNRIVAISKKLIPENCLGEFIGVAKFSSAFSTKFADSLDRLIKAGGKDDYFEAAIDPLLDSNPLYYEDVSDLPCIEVDFAEDLENARELAQSEWFNK